MKNLKPPRSISAGGHQGDVYIGQPIDPGTVRLGQEIARVDGALVLARGEATGHAHEILAPGARLFRGESAGICYLLIEGVEAWVEGSEIGPQHIALLHEEHGPGVFTAPGLYPVITQQQWTMEHATRVAD